MRAVGLLVAQGLDGIDSGGFDGGVYAEEEAHAHGDAHGEHHGPERNRRRKTGHGKVDQQTDAAAEQHADDASHAGEHNGFRKELPDNVAAASADGFTPGDLARALRDGHQHDVHHADTTNQQAYRTDDRNQKRHRSGDLPELVRDFRGARYAKIVWFLERNISSPAQHAANLVLGFRDSAWKGHRSDQILVVHRPMLLIGAVRQEHRLL